MLVMTVSMNCLACILTGFFRLSDSNSNVLGERKREAEREREREREREKGREREREGERRRERQRERKREDGKAFVLWSATPPHSLVSS